MFTRVPTDYGQDRRRPLTVVLVIAAAIYLLLTAAGTLWTDFLWFDSLGYRGVWLRNWSLSLLLGSLGIGIAFLALWVSLRLVDHFSPRWAPFDLTEEEELIERFREWVEPRIRQIRILVTASLAVIMGLAVATWRENVFLFMGGQTFGIDDPIFGLDVSFFMFQLPLLETAVDWLFNLLVLATVIVAVAQYLNGGIRFDGRRVSTTRGAKIHLSVMFALISLVRAASYRLDMYELLFANNAEKFFGPGFTDVTARLPALRLLLLIAVIAAVLFVVNIFRRGWTLAAVSVGAWVVVSIAAGSLYPAIIQRFSVLPNQLQKETPYISNNLEATKMAYGLDGVDVRPFKATDDLTAENIDENRLTIDNLRIWTTAVLPKTYQNFQELEPYYGLSLVDTDRYLDDGIPRQVMVAVRELEERNEVIPEDWQNTRLFYTHGYGAVVNQANVVQPDGQPVFLLKDVPPVASVDILELDEPRVYFGETYQPGRPVIVRTGSSPQEIDYPLPDGVQYNEYDGDAGVVIDSIWKRIAFAFRYRDLNLLISGQVRPDSKVLVERNVRSRVADVTPFLESDVDPYPVIIDGRIKWVVDLYTHSSYYPYSQPIDDEAWDRLARSSGLDRGTNYVRNSVKAVVDAHNGDVSYYLFDPTDPVARTWADTYPGLFKDISTLPDGLEDHLRYPQDLFRVQSQVYLDYHVTSENQLFSGDDAWSFPADPSTIDRAEPLNGDSVTIDGEIGQPLRHIMPYYLLTELPNEDELSYLLLQPFNPKAKRNMVGFLVADSTPGRFGRLIDFRMPQGELVDGTEQAGQRIEQDAEISEQLTLWRGEGSDVIKGDMLVVPIEESVLYVQPIYLEEAGGSFPEFRRVAVVFADRVEWADSLDGALALVFGEGAEDEPDDEPPPPQAGTIEELVVEAGEAFTRANDALREGDLAAYQRWVEEAERILRQIEELLAGLQDAAAPLHPS